MHSWRYFKAHFTQLEIIKKKYHWSIFCGESTEKMSEVSKCTPCYCGNFPSPQKIKQILSPCNAPFSNIITTSWLAAVDVNMYSISATELIYCKLSVVVQLEKKNATLDFSSIQQVEFYAKFIIAFFTLDVPIGCSHRMFPYA